MRETKQKQITEEMTLPGMTSRVEKLKRLVSVKPQICIERAELFTKSYRETEGEPNLIRRAKSLYTALAEMKIRIDDGELIVGKTSSKDRGAAMLPEVRSEWFVKELSDVSQRDWDQYVPLTEEEKHRIGAFSPYWEGKSRYDHWVGMLTPETTDLLHTISIGVAHCDNNMHAGHMSIDFNKVINVGFGAVRQECFERREKMDIAEPEEYEKYLFYQAVILSLDAVMLHTRRYASLAREMANREPDAVRRGELQRIADTCDWVSEHPARNFYEALQLTWFAYLGALIEGWGMSLGFGRFDQYMYPFYQRDVKAGILTRGEALELIELFIIKINSSIVLQSADIVHSTAGFLLLCNLTIAGTDQNGNDAVNEISHLVLEAENNVAGTGEDVAIRVSQKTADEFLMKALKIAKNLKGKFKWVGDETGIAHSIKQEKPEEIAREFCVSGCVNLTTEGRSSDQAHGYFNLPLCLELALNNGVHRLTGKQIGPRTGNAREFRSYQEIWNAFSAQVNALLPVVLLARNVDEQIAAELTPSPFQAAFFKGCLERGRDVSNGGTYPYMTRGISLSGVPNVGDAFAAMKRAVFEEKLITMKELLDALEDNFSGHDRVLHIIKKMPKFGNDDEYVDSITNEVLKDSYEKVRIRSCYGKSLSLLTLQTASANVPLGEVVGALPDGRRAGEPLSEGGISPHPGRNISGATATIRSINRLDLSMSSNGSLINMRFNPSALKDDACVLRFIAMLRTYLENGGFIAQFNFVDGETLRAAQREPEKYRDLLVRVATYSAYFVELSKVFQDNIIERIEFDQI